MITEKQFIEAQKIVEGDKFTHKSPHKCVGGYRKRKIVWQEVESHCV